MRRERERKRERKRKREKDRKTDRQTDKQREKERKGRMSERGERERGERGSWKKGIGGLREMMFFTRNKTLRNKSFCMYKSWLMKRCLA